MESTNTIDIIKDPIIGPAALTCAVFIPAIVINGVIDARFGFLSILTISIIIGVSIAYVVRKIIMKRGSFQATSKDQDFNKK